MMSPSPLLVFPLSSPNLSHPPQLGIEQFNPNCLTILQQSSCSGTVHTLRYLSFIITHSEANVVFPISHYTSLQENGINTLTTLNFCTTVSQLSLGRPQPNVQVILSLHPPSPCIISQNSRGKLKRQKERNAATYRTAFLLCLHPNTIATQP